MGAVCTVVLGLFASRPLHMVIDDSASVWSPAHLFSGPGGGVSAALTFGVLAGAAALATLRLTGDRSPAESSV